MDLRGVSLGASVSELGVRGGRASGERAIAACVARLAGLADASDWRHRVESLEPRALLSVGYLAGQTFASATPAGVLADIDNDGDADLLTTSRQQTGILNVFRAAAGTLATTPESYNTGLAVTLSTFDAGIAPLDYDNDGDTDVITNGYLLWRNNGAGVFTQISTIVATGRDLVVFDENGDVFPDLAIIQTAGTARILRGDGAGTFSLSPNVAPNLDVTWKFVGAGRVDADTTPDLIIWDDANDRIRVYRNLATGLVAGQTLDGVVVKPLAGRFNADTTFDLVWSDGASTPRLWSAVSDGAGGFAQPVEARERKDFEYSQVLALGFANEEDNNLDVLVRRRATSGTNPPQEYAFLLGSGTGLFDGLEARVGTVATGEVNFPVAVSDLSGDIRSDVVVYDGAALRTLVSTAGPVIGSFTGPTTRVIPGELLALQVGGLIQAGNRPITSVQFFIDANNNGRYDQDDRRLASVAPTGNQAAFTGILEDGLPAGNIKLFAVAFDSAGFSTIAEVAAALWTRVFYAEGFRTPDAVNEYIPLFNDNNVVVNYRVVLRYESGDRDQVLATGTIAPNSRGGLATTERNVPYATRPGVGYAIELQSDLPLGAMQARYDATFGNDGSLFGSGESFTNRTARQWGFADVRTRDFDFMLLYNPFPVTANVSITFTSLTGNDIVLTRTIEPFRRSGIALEREADAGRLNRFSDYSAKVVSDQPILAAHTRYVIATSRAFTSLGQYLDVDGQAFTSSSFVLQSARFGAGTSNSAVIFNPSSSQVTVQLLGSFDGTTQTSNRSLVIPAKQRVTVNLNSEAPGGAEFGTFRVVSAGVVYAFNESVDSVRKDSLGTSLATWSSKKLGFSDGFLNPNSLGANSLAYISLFNPQAGANNVRVRFLMPDGRSAQTTIALAPGESRILRLHETPTLTNLLTPTDFTQWWYATVLEADNDIVASMTHWDLFQPGGWATAPIPLDSINPIA